jgi:hypothetical protein
MVDEYTRECLRIDVARQHRSEHVLGRLAELFVERGAPSYLRSDNGSSAPDRPNPVGTGQSGWISPHHGRGPRSSTAQVAGPIASCGHGPRAIRSLAPQPSQKSGELQRRSAYTAGGGSRFPVLGRETCIGSAATADAAGPARGRRIAPGWRLALCLGGSLLFSGCAQLPLDRLPAWMKWPDWARLPSSTEEGGSPSPERLGALSLGEFRVGRLHCAKGRCENGYELAIAESGEARIEAYAPYGREQPDSASRTRAASPWPARSGLTSVRVGSTST